MLNSCKKIFVVLNSHGLFHLQNFIAVDGYNLDKCLECS